MKYLGWYSTGRGDSEFDGPPIISVDWTFSCGHTLEATNYEPVPEDGAVCPACDQVEWTAEVAKRLVTFRAMLVAGRMARRQARGGAEWAAAQWAGNAAHWAAKLVAA